MRWKFTYSKHCPNRYAFNFFASLFHKINLFLAAHCVSNANAIDFTLRLGEWDTQTKNELFPQKDFSVAEIIIHERFNKRNLENDVAIMILEDSVELSEHINTVCIPPKNFIFDRTRCFATGKN